MEICESCKEREVFRTYKNRDLCVMCYSREFKVDKNYGNWQKPLKKTICY